MSRAKLISDNLRLLVTQDQQHLLQKQAAQLEASQQALAESLESVRRQAGETEQRLLERLGALQELLEKRADKYEAAVDERLKHYQEALDARIEQRFTAVEQMAEARLTTLEMRADVIEHRIEERLGEMASLLKERLDAYSAALNERLEGTDGRLEQMAERIEERFTEYTHALDERFTEYMGEINARADAYETAATVRADAYESAVDARFSTYTEAADDRFSGYTAAVDARFDEYRTALEARIDERHTDYTAALDSRVDERLHALDLRLDERMEGSMKLLGERLRQIEDALDRRFDSRAGAIDNRVDDRLLGLERGTEQRMTAYERGLDVRLEQRELYTDRLFERMGTDLVNRTDALLQGMDQRIDSLRRAIQAEAKRNTLPATNGSSAQPTEAALAEVAARAQASLADPQAAAALYHQIIDWKKSATAKLNEFSEDELELVNYVLSFAANASQEAYARQHMRRFVATLQRLPPAQRTSARALELGSQLLLTPAIRKFAGYREVACADWWSGRTKVVQREAKQRQGTERYSFEVKNFNAETDAFPYPDGHFQLVLCCELLEHLMRDPLHLLWEANRVLEQNGFLLLTTPNITSTRSIEGLLVGCSPYLMSQFNVSRIGDQHHREYAPQEVAHALAAAGFSIIELETEDVWAQSNPAILELLKRVNLPTEMRGDNIFALARKTSVPVERYPQELYIK